MGPSDPREYGTWYVPALVSGRLPSDFERRLASAKDAEYEQRVGRRKLRSWRAYVWLQRRAGLPRHRRFESWVWDSPRERLCARNRSRNRRSFERLGLVSPNDGLEIDHIDGDCTNQDPSNLRVVTSCEHNRIRGKACVLRRR